MRTSQRRARPRAALATILVMAIVFALALGAGPAWAAGWSTQNSGASTNTMLSAIKFADASNGIAAGSQGTVLRTSDGGQTWSPRPTPDTVAGGYDYRGCDFLADYSTGVTRYLGWVVGTVDHRVFYTTNGGDTWLAGNKPPQSNAALNAVDFVDASNGWAVGESGAIWHSSDGGATWAEQDSGFTGSLRSVSFTDANNGWAGGVWGTILHTTNGGATWAAQTSGTDNDIECITFVNGSVGWAVGNLVGEILHTTNGGTTWTQQAAPQSNILNSVDFVDTNNGWACGRDGMIDHTTDGGSTWVKQSSGTSWTEGVYSIDFVNGSSGWACGDSGKIIHTADGGGTGGGGGTDSDDALPGVPLPASPARGVLTAGTDTYDFYNVLVKRGQRLTVALTGARGTDFDLFLFAPGSTMDSAVKLAESKRTSYPDTISYKARSRGTYYVLARTYTDTGSGSYKLTWSVKWDNTWADSISLSMSSHRAKLGSTVTFSGVVKPADAGAGRSCAFQVLEGKKWKTLWSNTISSSGRYSSSVWRSAAKGVRYYRVVLPAGFGYKQAISPAWAVTWR